MNEIEKLCEALRSYQQADEDGVIVKVSRQACDEAATALSRLSRENEELRASLAWAIKRIDKHARHRADEGDGELYEFSTAHRLTAALEKKHG